MELLYHVVLFRFRPDVDETTVSEVVHRFRALKHARPKNNIYSLDSGVISHCVSSCAPNESDANLYFTHAFVVTFRTEADRNYYLDVHDDHQQFKAFVGPLLDGGAHGVFVFDYWASEIMENNANACNRRYSMVFYKSAPTQPDSDAPSASAGSLCHSGINNSPEGLAKGFDRVLTAILLTNGDEGASSSLGYYLPGKDVPFLEVGFSASRVL
jgi:hypothetical protein